MSTVKVENVQHPDATVAALVLAADGTVSIPSLPVPALGDLTDVDTTGAVAGGVLTFDGTIFVPEVAPSAAGGLVAVKSAIFTGTQSESVTNGSNFAVTDLTITHALTDPANRLIISAFFGAASNSAGTGAVGIAVHDGTGLIAIGDADGVRSRVSAGGTVAEDFFNLIVTMPSVTFVHTPGDTDLRTYTVRAINIRNAIVTLRINRPFADQDNIGFCRAVSSLVIQEVAV